MDATEIIVFHLYYLHKKKKQHKMYLVVFKNLEVFENNVKRGIVLSLSPNWLTFRLNKSFDCNR